MSIRNLCPSEDLKESLGELNLRWKNLFVGNIYATGIDVDDDIDADVINVNHLYVNYINDFEISQTPKPNTIVVSRSDGTIHPDWYTVFATSTAVSALRYTGHTRTNAALYGGTTDPINLTRLNYDGSFYATRLQVTGDTRNPGFLYTGNQDPTNTTERLNYDGKFYATQFTATGTTREPGFFYTGNVDPISDHRLNYDGNLHMSRLRVTGTTKTAGMFYAGTDNPSNINRTNYDGYFYATQLYDDATRVVNYNRNIIAGNGLTGGGTLAANRTITLGTPSDITGTSTNSVTGTTHTHKFDTTTLATYSVLATSTETSVLRYTGHTKTPAALYGGATDPSATTRLNFDGYFYATQLFDDATRVVNYNRNIIAGNGLTGGGTLAADRTITLGTPSDITGTSTNSVTATSHTHKFNPSVLATYTD